MKTIVWDIDDVLNELMLCWFQYFCEIRQDIIPIGFDDLKKNPPCNILDISLDEYLTSLDNFRASENSRNMTPNNKIITWFHEYGHKYRHIALTSRSRKTISVLAEWLFRFYGDWIRTISFIPSERSGENLPVYDSSKAEFLKWLDKVDLFIDDSEENILDAKRAGVNAVLFPRPWNSSALTVDKLLHQVSNL